MEKHIDISQNKLLDNSDKLRLADYLNEIITNEKCTEICIATGYWDLKGTKLLYSSLAPFFERGGKMRLLIGEEPTIRKSQLQADHPKLEKFPDFFIQLDVNKLTDEYLPVAQMLVNNTAFTEEAIDEDSPIKIKVYGQKGEDKKFLHAKCYIFKGNADSDFAIGIVGSSNFTERGLEDNAELNYMEHESFLVDGLSATSTRKSHLTWFNEMWNDESCVDWTGKFINEILLKAPIAKTIKPKVQPKPEPVKPLSPYETYIKYLEMYFGDLTDESVTAQLKSYLPDGFRSYEYQMDAVKQCFHIMDKYGGFFLADVVGLGKTIVALLVVKRFIEEACATGQGDASKVLIITPPAVRKSWIETIQAFDEDATNKIQDHIKIVTTGSIGHLIDDDEEPELVSDEIDLLPQENYGLIMIDESHNFRNSFTQKYHALDTLIDQIAQQTGKAPFIGLMSATPQNNSPLDLRNQIYLFERNPQKSHFTDVQGRLDSYFLEKQRIFDQYRNDPSDEAKAALKELAVDIRQKVLNHIVVRRTRTDILKYYENDTTTLHFPTVCPPHKLEYEMDDELITLFSDTVNMILPAPQDVPDFGEHLGYYRYMAINFFRDKNNTRLYETRNLTVEGISARLAKITQILLVKRLESSFAAFLSSLENLRQYTQNMLDMLDHDCVFICPEIDVNAEFLKADFDFNKAASAIRAKIEKKQGNNREFRAADFTDEYRQLLLTDYQMIDKLCKRWKNNDLDPKFDAFKEALKEQLFEPSINNPHGYDAPRLVIFTEAISTQETLTRYLKSKKYRVLSVSAATRDSLQETIKENFDANSETRRDEYNVLVTTEVLAEGVNLHRSNVILNYDTPWNATRLMQRIGRVNRIGSKEDFVHVFNFFPTTQTNQQIHLIEKAYAKLQAFHTMFGEDNQVFSEREELSEANFNNMVNGEESAFSQYLADLKQYAKEQPKRYQEIRNMEAKELGGQLPLEGDNHIMLVATDKRRQACVRLAGDEAQEVISPLLFMQLLKEHIDCQYTDTDAEQLKALSLRAIRCFQSFVNRSLTGKDSQKRVKDALKIADNLYAQLTTPEAQKALKQAAQVIRGGNTTAIRIMEKYEQYAGQGLLFGLDEDINQWVVAMFGKLAQTAIITHGEPYIALYQL